MEKGYFVKDIQPYANFAGVFIILSPMKSNSRRGPFWKFYLADATGSAEAKLWYPKSGEFEFLPSGAPVFAAGSSDIYAEKLQLTVESLEILGAEAASSLSQRDFLPSAPEDPLEMFNELRLLCEKEITWPPLRKFVFLVLNDPGLQTTFKEAPAARSLHQAYLGGLLEHSLNVARICVSIANLYPELDRQLLIAAAVFHDIGKIREFSWDFSIEYTTNGNLLGHILMGLAMLEPFILKSGLESELADHFRHLILTHHGEYQYGSPKLPATAEAFVLHFADNLDAKINLFKDATANLEEGAWSDWQRGIDRRLLKPFQTPAKKGRSKAENQDQSCLSLWKE